MKEIDQTYILCYCVIFSIPLSFGLKCFLQNLSTMQCPPIIMMGKAIELDEILQISSTSWLCFSLLFKVRLKPTVVRHTVMLRKGVQRKPVYYKCIQKRNLHCLIKAFAIRLNILWTLDSPMKKTGGSHWTEQTTGWSEDWWVLLYWTDNRLICDLTSQRIPKIDFPTKQHKY